MSVILLGTYKKKIVIDKAVTTNVDVNKNHSHVNTTANVELDSSILEELKRTRASILLFELAKITQFRNEIVNAMSSKMSKLPQQLITSIDIQYSVVEGVVIGQRSRSVTSPFLLTFEIFNNNVHDCLVDSGASSNVMPFSMRQKLNIDPKKCNIQIV